MTTVTEVRAGGMEVRSIDYVPLQERHGKVWHLGPLWFMSNAQIATLAIGTIGVASGANLLWALVAIVTGTLFGSIFMAFHSAQGPQLGLPQMIQSRAQFGYVGALLVWLFAYLLYAGFNIFNTILAGQAIARVTGFGEQGWIIVATIAAFVVALVGYDVIHLVERWLAALSVVLFGVFTVGAAVVLHFPPGSFSFRGFGAAPFLLQFGVTAGSQISWAIYVSDYSRYLPPDVSVVRTSMWTYWGSGLGAIWLMGLGAVLAAASRGGFSTVGSLYATGQAIVGGFGTAVLGFSTLGLVAVTAINMYGGSLTMMSAVDSFRRVRPTLGARAATLAVTAALGLAGALTGSDSFLKDFEDFLLLVLYLFIPWTAVNLVDYYVVRRGHYAIAEIFNPRGRYGRWGWRGLAAYLVGFAAMAPFFSTSLYTGPVAALVGGADLSVFVGLPVAGGLYWLLSRDVDVDAEREVAAREAGRLEVMASRHRSPEDASDRA